MDLMLPFWQTSKINPIKPKTSWEKVKISCDEINFYQGNDQPQPLTSSLSLSVVLLTDSGGPLFWSLVSIWKIKPTVACVTSVTPVWPGNVAGCRPAVNLSQLPSYQPSQRQYFLERPQNLTVIEGESVTLRCKIGNLAGKVQWSTDGFAMGSNLTMIRSYCPKCSPRGNIKNGNRYSLQYMQQW